MVVGDTGGLCGDIGVDESSPPGIADNLQLSPLLHCKGNNYVRQKKKEIKAKPLHNNTTVGFYQDSVGHLFSTRVRFRVFNPHLINNMKPSHERIYRSTLE